MIPSKDAAPFMPATTDALPVMESFFTLQGEGAWTGTAAWFVRLAGCHVGCTWCDVKESWDASAHPARTIRALVDEARTTRAPVAVITGGEPTRHDLRALSEGLHNAGLRVHLETAGTGPVSGHFDWITLSPKKFLLPLEENYARADELKIIAANEHDFRWALEQARLVSPSCRLYMQAEWEKRERMYPRLMEFIRAHPQWCISVQTHKYLGVD
jgi:organic radical activating enzyme